MISVTRLRAGVTFEDKGVPFRTLKYEHTHISRGGGTIKIKVQNLANGRVGNRTYKSGAEVEEIEVSKKKLQFLYGDDEELIFMDPVTFEQLTLSKRVAGEQEKFLVAGEEMGVFMLDEKILDLDLPPKMVFTVAQTDPGEKGNSATNVFKPAMMDNSLEVKVPLFIKIGDRVKVDIRTGEYIERVS